MIFNINKPQMEGKNETDSIKKLTRERKARKKPFAEQKEKQNQKTP